MSSLKTSLIATMLAAVVITVYFAHQLHEEQQSTAQLRGREAQLQRQLQGARMRPALSRPAVNAVGAAAPAVARVAAQPGVAGLDGTAAYGRHLLALYPGLYKELGLNESEGRVFHKLLMSTDAKPADLQALLGSRYQQFVDFQNTSEARSWTTWLRQMLEKTANPLSAEQGHQLGLARLAEQELRNDELRSRSRDRPTEPRAVLDFQEQSLKMVEAGDARFAATARSYLKPQQVVVMQVLMNQQLSAQRAYLRIRSALVDAGGDGSAIVPRAIMPTAY